MLKRILILAFTFIFMLTTVVAYTAPCVDYMFYEEESGKYYIFGRFDEIAEDVGIYYKGDKYSYSKDGDTTPLDKANESGNLRYGIAFKAPFDYFEKLLIKPYSVVNGVEKTGKQKVYDKVNNSMKDDSVYFTDFSNEKAGEKLKLLSEYTYQEVNNTAERTYSEIFVSKEENKEGEPTNMVKFTDSGRGSSGTLKVKVPEYEGCLTVEMRFKFTQPVTNSLSYDSGAGFILDFNGGGKRALRITRFPGDNSGLSLMNSGGTVTITNGADVNDKWLTLKAYLDTKRGYASVSLECDEFGEFMYDRYELLKVNYLWQDYYNSAMCIYNQTLYEEYKGVNIDEISFSTYNSTAGEYLIDYINVYTEGEAFYPKKQRAESKPLPVIADPIK